jgi:hypothetical protein
VRTTVRVMKSGTNGPIARAARLIGMRCPIPVVAVALLSCVIPHQAGAAPAGSIVQDVAVAARALVPLLKDVRARIEPRIVVEPGTVPPSPLTGRSSTLFAVRIGVRSRQVDQAVVQAMDRLLAWKPDQPLAAEDLALVARWLDELSVKVLGRLAAARLATDCDQVCVVQRLTNPDSVFGATAREQQDARDDILLEALIEAVKEQFFERWIEADEDVPLLVLARAGTPGSDRRFTSSQVRGPGRGSRGRQ